MKKQRHYFTNKCPSSQSYGFSRSHAPTWELDHKESWVPKNWCFWTVVLVKTLESPLDFKENKSVNPKGNQSWIFTGRTVAEAEAPIIWPPDVKNWLTGKDSDAGKDWRWQENGTRTTEDEMVGWNQVFWPLIYLKKSSRTSVRNTRYLLNLPSETMETVTDFIFWGSKITADGDSSLEIKRYLLLRGKGMNKLDSILKAETWLCQQRSL